MNEPGARMQTLVSRWAAALVGAVAGLSAAVRRAVVVSGRGPSTSSAAAMTGAGAHVPRDSAAQVTSGLRRGWPPSVWARARGPPGGGVRWPVPCARVVKSV